MSVSISATSFISIIVIWVLLSLHLSMLPCGLESLEASLDVSQSLHILIDRLNLKITILHHILRI